MATFFDANLFSEKSELWLHMVTPGGAFFLGAHPLKPTKGIAKALENVFQPCHKENNPPSEN